MEYCGPRGLAHDEFLQWSPHARDAALSWLVWSREACSSCGTRPDEWNPERGGHLHAYEAVRHVCRGCEVRARAEKDLAKDAEKGVKGGVRGGTSIVLVPTTEVPVG